MDVDAKTKTTPAATTKALPVPSDSRVQKNDPTLSFDDIRSKLFDVLREAYPQTGEGCNLWPVDIYDAVVVFSNDDVLMVQPYSITGGVATLSGTPEQVRRVYVSATDSTTPPAPGVAADAAVTAAKSASLAAVTKAATSRPWYKAAKSATEKKSPAT